MAAAARRFRDFPMPDVGEGLTEAEILKWLVQPGDMVTDGQMVVEVETAKAAVELPIPYDGQVRRIHVAEGATVDVGTPIITVDTEPGAPDEKPPAPPDGEATPEPPTNAREPVLVGYGVTNGTTKRRPRKRPEPPAPGHRTTGPAGTGTGTAPAEPNGTARTPRPPADAPGGAVAAPGHGPQAAGHGGAVQAPGHDPHSPGGAAGHGPQAPGGPGGAPGDGPQAPRTAAGHGGAVAAPGVVSGVRVLAKPPVRKLAKDLGVDLAAVVPSGDGGVITRHDVHAAATPAGVAADADADVAAPAAPRERRVAVKGVRRATAQAVAGSAFTAPHVTEFVTVDVTRTVRLVQRLKEDRDMAGVRVTPLLLVARALLLAIRRNPDVNASWDEANQEIVYKDYVNLGIAAATPRGLIVPNIKDADAKSLPDLGRALAELVGTAREGRTTPADMSGGTVTITNIGVFGIDSGTPILNPGESAILAFGAIKLQPWVHKGKVKPRHVTTLALSFDHRLVDGELGSRVLADVAAVLEQPRRLITWG